MTLRNIPIGVRGQAASIIILAALWWLAFFHDSVFGFPSAIWLGIGYFFPFVMIIFSAILLISYRGASHAHKWFVWTAVLSAVSPWIVLLLSIIDATRKS